MAGLVTRECHLGIPLQASTSISPPYEQGSLEGEGVFYDCSVQTVIVVCKQCTLWTRCLKGDGMIEFGYCVVIN